MWTENSGRNRCVAGLYGGRNEGLVKWLSQARSGRRPLLLLVAVIAFQVGAALVITEEACAQKTTKPAVLEAKIVPKRLRSGDTPTVKVKLNEASIRAEVVLFVNDEKISLLDYGMTSEGVAFDHSLERGDKVKIEITPFGWQGQKGSKRTLKEEVRNSPPTMKLVNQGLNSGTYNATLEATDPDGETPELSLKESPEGMEIDQDGNISWKLPEGISGDFKITVLAKDKEGAASELHYTFSIRQKQRRR